MGCADDFRMRGGLEFEEQEDGVHDDPLDAEEFFHAHGLPNLLADDAEEHEQEQEAGGGAWCREKLDKPLYPGCKYTVEQYSYALFRVKTGSIHDDRADMLCKLISEAMPEGYAGPTYVAGPHRKLDQARIAGNINAVITNYMLSSTHHM